MRRNARILQECINVLTNQVFDAPLALRTLEEHFEDMPIVNAGNTTTIEAGANQLRLRVEQEEWAQWRH